MSSGLSIIYYTLYSEFLHKKNPFVAEIHTLQYFRPSRTLLFAYKYPIIQALESYNTRAIIQQGDLN